MEIAGLAAVILLAAAASAALWKLWFRFAEWLRTPWLPRRAAYAARCFFRRLKTRRPGSKARR